MLNSAATLSPHSEPLSSVLTQLEVDPTHGLSDDEARERLRLYGPNELSGPTQTQAWRILLSQFSSIVIWLLIAAAVVAYFTDSAVEAMAIGVVLVLNALIGFTIEWQAQKSLDALRRSTRTTCRVRRGRRESVIDAADLVRGDIALLSTGDRVPADARLIEAVNLRVDESTLTGESLPVEKSMDQIAAKTPLAERHSMLYLGTNVVAGRAVAAVTSTGRDTEIGHIGQMIEQAEDTETPLERRLAELGRRLVYLVLAVGLVVLIAGVIRGNDWWLMAKVSVSLAVAAVPEGLPAVTTLILALGLLRLARRSAIVRRLASVETLGSTTVICTDKTGTLTENRMAVQEVFLSGGRLQEIPDVSSVPTHLDNELRRILRVGVVCSEASFHPSEKTAIGDPTETALLVAASDFGMDVGAERIRYKQVFEVPFDTAAKRMTVVVTGPGSERIALLKGAPAVVLDSSDRYLDSRGSVTALDQALRSRFLATNEQMAGRGWRILAFADKALEGNKDELDAGYIFLGLMGMTDPPREGALEAVRDARNAGIRVVMLTGDQAITAQAIARELELSKDHDVGALHSRDLVDADEGRVADMAKSAHVFARVTPEDKLRIVRALQQAGEIVAVTGDGVNDAAALKQADIGIAFGERGTDVAKEAADVVLTDDNFSTIVRAIEGGRTIYANIIKFVHLMFSHNLGEIVVIFVAVGAGLPLPLMPLQILWINLVTDVFPALALAVEPPSPNTMRRRPRSPSDALLSRGFMFLVLWQGAMLAAIVLGAYLWALRNYGEGGRARTVALLSLIAVQLGHLFNCRSRSRSAFVGFFSNPFIFAAVLAVSLLQVAAVYFSPLASVLGVVKPSSTDWLVIAVSFVLPIALVEVTKLLTPKDRERSQTL